MTHLQYVALMMHWFGDEIVNHPGLQGPEYADAIKTLLPLTPDERYTFVNA